MNRPHAILLPTDFSPAVSAFAPEIREVTVRFGAHLTVLHAFHLVPDYAVPPHGHHTPASQAPPYTPELLELRNRMQRQLDEFVDREFSKVPCTACLEDGAPAKAIEWIAKRDRIDLIAMPTRPHGKFRRLLMGSVTAQVLHDTACPVLTNAHCEQSTWPVGEGYRSILAAIEMNWEAAKILEAACVFADAYQARLCVVHVDSRVAGDEREEIGGLLEHYAGHATKASVRLLEAPVAAGIHRAAIEQQADLLVVGRGHEKDGLARMRSPLYEIIRQAPCAVLSV